MATTPEITERAEQPYVAIKADVTMEQLPRLADQLGEVFGWLAGRGVDPAGPPFFRYNVIDMAGLLAVEAGVPVAAPVVGGDRVIAGVLPGGRYGTALHVGPYDGLIGAVDNLLQWADGQGLEWDRSSADDGEHWGCRLEIYLTDPRQQPDPSKWETELSFRLKLKFRLRLSPQDNRPGVRGVQVMTCAGRLAGDGLVFQGADHRPGGGAGVVGGGRADLAA